MQRGIFNSLHNNKQGVNDMEFFAFRINKLKILKNREWGEGELKLLSFVTTGDASLPVLDQLLQTTDSATKKQIIQSASQQVLSAKEFVEIDHINDGHVMIFGDAGYALYTADKIPTSFNWTFLAMESDQDINALGQRIDNIIGSTDFDSFTTNLLAVLSTTATPQITAGIAIGKFLSRAITKAMIENKDDQVGVYYLSLNRMEHYPYGERKRDDVSDLSNNLLVDYSIFGTTYTA